MSLTPPRRFAGATTVTAVVALLLIVPTVLHVADPAFGQGTGSNGGYSSVVTVGENGRVEASTPVGNVTAGQRVNASVTLPVRTTLLEPTGVGSTLTKAQILRHALEQPKLGGVTITARNGGTGVNVVMKEYLADDTAQSALVAAPGTPLTSIRIKVAVPATEGAAASSQAYKVLKVVEIHAEGLEKGDVESAEVNFRVFPEDLEELGLTVDDIVLLHQLDNGSWEALPTTLVSVDEDGVMNFVAITPSFSYFAVGGKDSEVETAAVAPSTGSVMWVALAIGAIAIIAIAVFVVVGRRK